MNSDIEIVPYGAMRSAASTNRWRTKSSRSLERTRQAQRLFVTFAYDLDESFAELFREQAAPDTRLLIVNEGTSTDRLLARIIDLQIRTPQRFYVIDAAIGS